MFELLCNLVEDTLGIIYNVDFLQIVLDFFPLKLNFRNLTLFWIIDTLFCFDTVLKDLFRKHFLHLLFKKDLDRQKDLKAGIGQLENNCRIGYPK